MPEVLSEEVEALDVSISLPALSFFCFVTVVLLTVGVSKIVYKKSGRGKRDSCAGVKFKIII